MITYFYYDDEKDKANSHAEFLSDSSSIIVKYKEPKNLKETLIEIRDSFKEKQLNGLILDLRLDIAKINGVYYRGTTLAQELRTENSEGESLLPYDFPIILLSSDANLLKYNSDDSSHGLFDMIISKDKYSKKVPNREIILSRLIALSNGYKLIQENKKDTLIHKLLGLEEDKVSFLFPKFIYSLKQLMNKPVHVIARFIKNKLIEVTGLLVDRDILLARLGVDKDNTNQEALNSLFELVKKFQYKGAFHEGWELYWMDFVKLWWDSDISKTKTMKSLSASKRIEIISEKTGIKGLVSAKPLKNNYSDFFWTVCILSRKPIDPMNGFISISKYDPINENAILSDNQDPWIEKDYVTKGEFSKNSRNIILDSIDAELIKEH